MALGCGLILLQGCSQQASQPQANTEQPESDTQAASRAFPAETLYALLVAEMAGNREEYQLALAHYLQQAHKTRDPAVTARATRIARYLNAHKAALNAAQLWIQLQPDNHEARLIVASELAHSGRLNEALGHAKLLIELDTNLFQSIAARAAKATDTQREQLLDEFNELLELHPDKLQLLVGKGLLLQQQERYPEALTQAQRALKLKQDHIPAATLEAKLLHQLDQSEQALQRLLTLIEEYPKEQRLRLQYARLLASYDLEQAHQQFKILAEQSPNDPDLIFSLAIVCNEREQFEEAEQHFRKLLTLGRRQSSAHYYLGRLIERRAEQQQDASLLPEALEHYLHVKPGANFMPAQLHSTELLVRKNKPEVAHQHLNGLRERFPSQAERFYLLESDVLTRHQRLDRAEQVLSLALVQFPTSSSVLYARAMVNEARDFLELSEQDLRTIIRYEPNNATALNALGYTLANQTTRYDEAFQLISQALQLKPDDPAIIDSMGWVQYRLGNLEEALLRLRQAMQAFPDHEIAAHLGEVLWVSGERREAESIWQQGLELKPDSQIIPSVMDRLQSESDQ